MITSAHLVPITAAELANPGLLADLVAGSTTAFEAYCLKSHEAAETGWLVFVPAAGRAGIAWGGDPAWTDASSAEDALDRWIRGDLVN